MAGANIGDARCQAIQKPRPRPRPAVQFGHTVFTERARFIEHYDDNIDRARLDLGKLFRIGDYPSKEALQGKFGIRDQIVPVPDADHFMASRASHDTERVERGIEREIEQRLHDAVSDLYPRLGEAVERVSERLTEDGEGKPLVFRVTMCCSARGLRANRRDKLLKYLDTVTSELHAEQHLP